MNRHENISPLSESQKPSDMLLPEERSLIEKMDFEGYAKEAPRFADQLQEDDRINPIVYIKGGTELYYTKTSNPEYKQSRETIAEIDALKDLNEFLLMVEQESSKFATTAKSMRENLTYIGEKEYKEAAAGIAAYWKLRLDDDPELQILAIVGEIAKGENRRSGNLPIKSDEYLLENILAHFSDDEIQYYAGRLVVDAKEVTADLDHVRAVLLDDWTLSGGQLDSAQTSFAKQYPHLAEVMEVQLIVADGTVIEDGIEAYDARGAVQYLDVWAYYRAHPIFDDKMNRSIAVTGSHSSTDFGYESVLAGMVEDLRKKDPTVVLPASTNYVRPYRYDDYDRNKLVRTAQVRQATARIHRRDSAV